MKFKMVKLSYDDRVYVIEIPESVIEGSISIQDEIILDLLNRLEDYNDKNQKVVIRSCNDSKLWYNEHIGETYEVISEDKKNYWCRNTAGFENSIKKIDIELI